MAMNASRPTPPSAAQHEMVVSHRYEPGNQLVRHRVTWEDETLTCCPTQTSYRIDAGNPPRIWVENFGEVEAELFQCGGCGAYDHFASVKWTELKS